MTRALIRTLLASILAVSFLFLSNGCSKQSSAPPADLAPLSNSVGNFEDIELPSEMKWDSKKSMAIVTDSFRGGILVYTGKVEMNSLKDFLSTSMENHKWKRVGEASSEEIMMAFIKPNKTCMVTLKEGFGGSLGSTYLTMYITVDVAAGQRLNPFGEPVGN
jgi:hypothetical protein